MQRRIMILEDDRIAMENIMRIISGLHKDIAVFCADTLEKAYSIVMEQQIHLLIVDIILKPENPCDVSGFRFVQELREMKKYAYVPVIFVTSLEDPKLYSYSELNCFGYIEKPYDEEMVRKYVLRALDFPIKEDKDRCIYFRRDGIAYCRHVSEIYYLEISRRRILVHCRDEVLEIPYKTSEEIMKELDSPEFVKCSRHFIVNKRHIDLIDYTRRYIKMRNLDDLIEIGATMKKRLRVELENESGGLYRI